MADVKPTGMDDDELVSTCQDLIEEIGAGDGTTQYVDSVEEVLDEEGELNAEQREKLGEILGELRERKAKGDIVEEDDDFDDLDESDDLTDDEGFGDIDE